MTTKQKFISMLVACGMFESQAEKVMETAMPQIDTAVENYRFTWDRPASEYPEIIYTVVFNTHVKPAAVEWIDANLPQAWFRGMFV